MIEMTGWQVFFMVVFCAIASIPIYSVILNRRNAKRMDELSDIGNAVYKLLEETV